MRDFIRKVSWVTIANATAMLVSVLITIILPKYVTETEYGYWQMYLLFVTYIGCIHLGLPDGIYLRYSGKEYCDVVHNDIRILFWISSAYEILIGLVLFVITARGSLSNLAIGFAICTCVYVPSLYLKYVMLASNMMRQYSIYVVSEKTILILSILFGLFVNKEILHHFIFVDVIGKAVALVYAGCVCRDVFYLGKSTWTQIWKEYKANVLAGICLMISTVSSNFIVGVIRIFIDIKWSIEDFGKVSLALQISNFILTFVRAVSLPLFPVIKRQSKDNVIKIYDNLRIVLITIILGLMISYFPLSLFLVRWLPNYSISIYYLGILFPISLFEAKQALLCETYLKNYRKERFLLCINVGTMFLSIAVSSVLVFALKNQTYAIVFILIVLGFRSTVSEIYLNRFMGQNNIKNIVLELAMVGLFTFGNLFLKPGIGAGIYFFGYILFVTYNAKDYKKIYFMIKEKQ